MCFSYLLGFPLFHRFTGSEYPIELCFQFIHSHHEDKANSWNTYEIPKKYSKLLKHASKHNLEMGMERSGKGCLPSCAVSSLQSTQDVTQPIRTIHIGFHKERAAHTYMHCSHMR